MKTRLSLALLFLFACRAPEQELHGVTIVRTGKAAARIVITTATLAIKETGPAETVKQFGEVYAFSPEVFAVRRDQPTQITFWNLQPDDEHDFMLTDPKNKVLVQTKLPPLSKTTYVMTFHDEGVFPFYCTVHQPSMSGQILVGPPAAK
jgi:plastocyanin